MPIRRKSLQTNKEVIRLIYENKRLREEIRVLKIRLNKANAQLQKGNIPNVIGGFEPFPLSDKTGYECEFYLAKLCTLPTSDTVAGSSCYMCKLKSSQNVVFVMAQK